MISYYRYLLQFALKLHKTVYTVLMCTQHFPLPCFFLPGHDIYRTIAHVKHDIIILLYHTAMPLYFGQTPLEYDTFEEKHS